MERVRWNWVLAEAMSWEIQAVGGRGTALGTSSTIDCRGNVPMYRCTNYRGSVTIDQRGNVVRHRNCPRLSLARAVPEVEELHIPCL